MKRNTDICQSEMVQWYSIFNKIYNNSHWESYLFSDYLQSTYVADFSHESYVHAKLAIALKTDI